MRLLNVNTRQLEEFFGDAIPPYAILSHTWGKEEVLLHDLTREGHRQKQGYAKIEGCCRQASKDGLRWVWVDTCCIDKTSSAELSEAINSMYRWYENSKVCYAYMQDVPSGSKIYRKDSAFRKSRWFTRGWTLQELLAPSVIEFYDTNWRLVSDTKAKQRVYRWFQLLHEITSIPSGILLPPRNIRNVPAASKFSWMARRSTTRVEDVAYCLLGLLNINMPLLYGEGAKAFIRLQEAILSSSDDMSPLAWGYDSSYTRHTSYLATSPSAFCGYPRSIRDLASQPTPKTHTTVTGRGLHIELCMILIDERSKVWLGIVDEETFNRKGLAIVLQEIRGNIFTRVSTCPPVLIATRNLSQRTERAIESKQIYIARDSDYRVDTWSVATGTILERLLSCVQSRSRTSICAEVAEYEVEIKSILEIGYSFSSAWPLVWEYWLSDKLHFVRFGPPGNVFYVIFSHTKRDPLGMRIEIEWGRHRAKVVKMTFCVLTGQQIGYTALEHCCGTKFCVLTGQQIGYTALEHSCGTKFGSKAPQFAEDMHWSPYLTAENVNTNEIGYVYAADGGLDRSNLVWKKGVYSEEGSVTINGTCRW